MFAAAGVEDEVVGRFSEGEVAVADAAAYRESIVATGTRREEVLAIATIKGNNVVAAAGGEGVVAGAAQIEFVARGAG